MIISGDSLQPSSGSNITVPDGLGIRVGSNVVGKIGSDYGAFKGNVVQCKVLRYDTITTVTTGTSVDGIEITGMRVTITPKFSNSMILCMFQVFGEGATTHQYMANVFKNGVVPTGTYAGFNTQSGNQIWSGLAMAVPYETDYGSTPYQSVYYYHDFPGVTSQLTYAPGIKSDGTSRVFYVNRPVTLSGQASYENGVSFSIALEIAQ